MNTNPIESVSAWCEGVGHGPETLPLYVALVAEEAGELLDELSMNDGLAESYRRMAYIELWSMSGHARKTGCGMEVHDREALLDAALDTAWVALCLARALTGERLPAAWAELHRSNITDKQQDGQFVRDASGKIQKPATWRAPDFGRFLLEAVESEGGTVD